MKRMFFLVVQAVLLSAVSSVAIAQSHWACSFHDGQDSWCTAVQNTSDGGFIAAGSMSSSSPLISTSAFLITKLDANGEFSPGWQYAYRHNAFRRVECIQEHNGEYFVGGYTTESGKQAFLLMKLDGDGNVLWTRVYAHPNHSTVPSSMVLTNDEALVIAGRAEEAAPPNSQDAWVMKLHPDNDDIEWQRTYDYTYLDSSNTLLHANDSALSVSESSDGGYVVAGNIHTLSYGYNPILLKLEPNGDVHTAARIQSAGDNDQVTDMTYDISSDMFALTGFTDTNFHPDGSLNMFAAGIRLFFDATPPTPGWKFLKLWEAAYEAQGPDFAYSIDQTTDGNYVLAGSAYMPQTSSMDALILKVDSSSGSLIWSRGYGGYNLGHAEDDGFYSICRTESDEFAVGGYTKSFPHNSLRNMWLMNLNDQGKIDGPDSCMRLPIRTDPKVGAMDWVFGCLPGFQKIEVQNMTGSTVTPSSVSDTPGLSQMQLCPAAPTPTPSPHEWPQTINFGAQVHYWSIDGFLQPPEEADAYYESVIPLSGGDQVMTETEIGGKAALHADDLYFNLADELFGFWPDVPVVDVLILYYADSASRKSDFGFLLGTLGHLKAAGGYTLENVTDSYIWRLFRVDNSEGYLGLVDDDSTGNIEYGGVNDGTLRLERVTGVNFRAVAIGPEGAFGEPDDINIPPKEFDPDDFGILAEWDIDAGVVNGLDIVDPDGGDQEIIIGTDIGPAYDKRTAVRAAFDDGNDDIPDIYMNWGILDERFGPTSQPPARVKMCVEYYDDPAQAGAVFGPEVYVTDHEGTLAFFPPSERVILEGNGTWKSFWWIIENVVFTGVNVQPIFHQGAVRFFFTDPVFVSRMRVGVIRDSGVYEGVDPISDYHSEADFFYANGEVALVQVALDQIGVLVKEGVSPERMTVPAQGFNLTFVREVAEAIAILGLPEPTDRLSLAQLARDFKAQNSDLVAQAGLVVTPEQAEQPIILTDEFVAQFNPDLDGAEVKNFNDSFAVEIVMENPFVGNLFLLRVTDETGMTALEASRMYEEDQLVEYAHPNFVHLLDIRQAVPNVTVRSAGEPPPTPTPVPTPTDPLFGDQWHHNNTGQSNGTEDADIDTLEAWGITRGAPDVVIAVIDSGFDMTHPDLTPNYWTNLGETAGDNVDNDGNTFIDDIHGWDFTGCTVTPTPGCGDNDPTGGSHGTAVAGSAAARGDNNIGVTGSCQLCNLMVLRLGIVGSTPFTEAMAFDYARTEGAHIITNSWGYIPLGTPIPTVVTTAINNAATNGRNGLGCVVLFAMTNNQVDNCVAATLDISSLASVIAVSRSTNLDRFDLSGFGECMDVLAPSGFCGTVPGRGTLWATTTDVQGTDGYNNVSPHTDCTCPSTEQSPPPTDARDYTFCFRGTSFSAPLTAGVAGLILSANANLTSVQVQRLLQDTADKIEDSQGSYHANTGFSSPASGVATHGWGRVNAFEAVRVAAPVADGGRGGVDIFLRDNRLDWGNTEQPSNTLFEPQRGFIGYWESMDIKVDAPPHQTPPTATTFDTFTDETPSAVTGDTNRVYVRVRNRGPVNASSVTVKLFWTQFGTALPALPSDFWTSFPSNPTAPSEWHPLNCSGSTSSTCTIANLGYSGSSVAGTTTDAAQIVEFDFPAPGVDLSKPNHFCLLAMVDSPQDPILSGSATPADFIVDTLTPYNNNVTHRNYKKLSTGTTTKSGESFFVRNPTDETIDAVLRLSAPEGWEVVLLDGFSFDEPFTLGPNDHLLVKIEVYAPQRDAEGEVTVIQEDESSGRVMGGVTYNFGPDYPVAVETWELH